ncbi:MAG TPA: ribosome biogenesis GTP-binding protein YihA/YsxC [Polyangiaceae bacterium]
MKPDVYESELRIVQADFTAAAMKSDQLPPATGIEIAFAGRSNVGKSSLMNSLLARKNLVRTSSKPGSTRTVSFFEARAADGLQLKLVDLPGYGYAKRSKAELAQWGQLMEDYLLGRPTLAAVVLLVDARRGLEVEDRDLLTLLGGPARVTRRPLGSVLAATKLDKIATSAQAAAISALRRTVDLPIYGYSAETHAGRPELWRAIRKAAGLTPAPPA